MMKNKAMEETACMASLVVTNPSTEGPISMPAKISPTTEGRHMRSNSSPTKRAAARTIRASVMMVYGKSPRSGFDEKTIYVQANKHELFLGLHVFWVVKLCAAQKWRGG